MKTKSLILFTVLAMVIVGVVFAMSQESEDRTVLLSQLHSDNWQQRAAAEEKLTANRHARMPDEVKNALIDLLDRESRLIESTLRESNGLEGVSVKYGEGYSEYYSLLAGAVDQVADYNDKRILNILVHSSYNPDSPFAVKLASHGEAVVPMLLEMANSDLAPYRGKALGVLGEILKVEKYRAVPLPEDTREQVEQALIRGTGDENVGVRMLGVRSLGLLGLLLNGNGERTLVAAASDRSPTTVQSTSKKPPVDDHSAFCEEERKRVRNVVQEIFRDYQRSDSPKSIELLVDLDHRIRALLNSRPPYRQCEDDSGIYDRRWEEIGVNLGYWVDLAYSGRLLDEAHKSNPNSLLRRYTLFSTIFGVTSYHGLGMMPDIKAALNYASEFPDGPFAKETFRIIADFHKDLFMVLRDKNRDYKYNCYQSYITKKPIKTQKERAKRTALKYYRKALEIEPSNQEINRFLNDVDNETVRAWSFCAD